MNENKEQVKNEKNERKQRNKQKHAQVNGELGKKNETRQGKDGVEDKEARSAEGSLFISSNSQSNILGLCSALQSSL